MQVCGSRSWLNWTNLGAYIVNVAVTYASVSGTFGKTNQELSGKYQTLVTPAGWAFSIWGLIFIWEGAWALAQMMGRYSGTKAVKMVTPWWWAVCVAQLCWTLAFAQEAIHLSLFLMLAILFSLLWAVLCLDRESLSLEHYVLLRAPFAVHLGWIILASAVSINVVADADRAAPSVLLGLAVASLAAVVAISMAFTCGVRTPEPVVCLVASWAFLSLGAQLRQPEALNNPDRHNPYKWDPIVLDGLHRAAIMASVATLALALTSTALRVWRAARAWRVLSEDKPEP